MAGIYKSGLFNSLATGVVQWRAFTEVDCTTGWLQRSAVAGIYKNGLFNRLAICVVPCCAFLHAISNDNELQKTLTAGIVRWCYFHHEKCRLRALARI